MRTYVATHPGVGDDDLLGVSLGDDLERVLVVLRNPDAGFSPIHLRVRESRAGGLEEWPRDEIERRANEARGTLLIDFESRCGRPNESPGGWVHLRDGRTDAFDLQSFANGCRPETSSFETRDHAALREVGSWLYRPIGHGRFRYGALTFDHWHDAFAAPTQQATLSLLQQEVDRNPGDARARQWLAVVLDAGAQRRRAQEMLERAALLDPDWRLPLENLRVLHALQGDRPAVVKLDDRLRALDGRSRPAVSAPALR